MKKVLIIGDSCIDIFEYGECRRICPEAPVPVLNPTEKKQNYGMAYNVYVNLLHLDIDCDIVTNEKKPVKTRYIDETSNQMIIRIDQDDQVEELSWNVLKSIDFSKYDIVVISDYNKGFLSKTHIAYITASCRPYPRITFLDTKKEIGSWCNDVDYIKINQKEYERNHDFLMNEYRGNLIVTRGKDETLLNPHKEHPQFFSIKNEHPVRDLTGAGDTFLAGLVAKYSEKGIIEDAIEFANRCATWAVTQKGVAIISLDKIEL